MVKAPAFCQAEVRGVSPLTYVSARTISTIATITATTITRYRSVWKASASERSGLGSRGRRDRGAGKDL